GDPLMQALASEPGYDLRGVVASIDQAAADDRIEAIWLQIRAVQSPWSSLQEIRSALLRFKESGKPIYASSDDYMMAEAEYYVASAADSVFANEQAMFEFNGFYMTLEFYQGLLEKLEVEPQIIRAGKFKSAVEPFIREDLSPENEAQLTAILDTQNDEFMQAVAESRGLSADSLKARASNEAILTATSAFDAGLLDGLLYDDQVRDIIKRRLGVEEDDDLEAVSMESYTRVPPSDAGLDVNRDGDIAIVYAEGAIVSGESSQGSPFSGAVLGAETLAKAMREARENEDVKAVVLRINSPGGSASASDAMWREIKLTAEKKPLVVSMGSLAASGGYWIATAGETIVADPLTITGSIGVFALLMDVSGLFENKLGITFDGIRTSPYADIFSGVRPLSEAEQAMLGHFVDETYDDFVQRVAESRGIDPAQVDSIGQGRVWTGRDALDIGLVDTLGSLKNAVEIAARKAELGDGPYRVRILPRPKTFFEQLSESLNAKATSAWMRITGSPLEEAVLRQARTLAAAAEGSGEVQARLMYEVRVK
ncbi:MAG: signal peptide peptidase SppA, partial [Rhodothermales bacterium]